MANRCVMASYATWCKAHGDELKKATGLAQSLAAHGLEIAVNGL
ncbi:MAG TPA: hypothetical protein VHZ51_10665 [Ktedonobacteraceae bacterium]|nr:hypothetical protein [Ktedonobacteraceae bacterium]